MLGVGIGIDYALFIVSRFREELTRGMRAGGETEPGRGAASRGQVEDAVGAAIGAAAVADVLYLNIRERVTEFATLRALGWL